MRILIHLMLCAACLSGCGFKGPLYLPEPEATAAKSAAARAKVSVTPATERAAPTEAIPAPE